MKREKEVQEIYIQLQIVEQYIKNMQRQLEIVEAQFIEMNMTNHSIDEFKKLKEGTEMFVPLSSGIFAKASLKDTKSLLLNVGSEVAVKKNPESAKEIIEKQIKELSTVREKITAELEKLVHHAEAYQHKLQQLANEESG